MSKRKSISQKTERVLWAISAGRCEKCGRLLYRHPLSQAIGNFAQIAHNVPVSDFGPRSDFKGEYKRIDPGLDIDSIDNLLLLCYDCHREIDETNPDKFPPHLLKQIKYEFENFILKSTNIERIIPTTVVRYSSNLHGQRILITDVERALSHDKAIYSDIDLSLKDSCNNIKDINYWSNEESHLVNIFKERVKQRLEDCHKIASNNFSVFSIGPIPLLVKLGTLLSNKNNIDVYQLKKSPIQTWKWDIESFGDDFDYKINYIQKKENAKKIILLCSLSGIINQTAVKKVISFDDADVLEIRTTCQAYDDFLRTKDQLNRFVLCFRKLKEEMLGLSSKKLPVHLFAAIPCSVAVEIGRQWNPSVDLPMVIYNLTEGRYEKALTIGEINE